MLIVSVKEHRPLSDDKNFNEVFNGNEDLLKRFPYAQSESGNHLLGCFIEGWPGVIIKANYYVGVSWLEEGKSAIQVRPKVENLDFMKMFMKCLECKDRDVQNKIHHIYGIVFNKTPLKSDDLRDEVTPFIILHYISLLKPIIQKGLKRNYVLEEDNLQSKLKGKLLFAQHLKRNVLIKRLDRNHCRFQEYSFDCLENQILKKATHFVSLYLKEHNLNITDDHRHTISSANMVFGQVSDVRMSSAIERFRINPLFKDYARAIDVAKIILRRFGYDIQQIEDKSHPILPFWIDMSLLFETYVLSMLKQAYPYTIKYHIATYGNEIDFGKTDESLIIDSKYMYWWENDVNHDNIRQLSGYARNKSIRIKLLGDIYEKEILPCLIIYPSESGVEKFAPDVLLKKPDGSLNNGCTQIEQYIEFFKVGVKLPLRHK